MTSERKLLAVTTIILVLLLALTGCATKGSPLGNVRDFARDDVQRGLEIANAYDDPAGATCALAILSAVDSATPLIPPVGVFSTFIAAREARRKLDGGVVSNAIHEACAVVILDAEMTLGRIGLMAVPGGGIAGKLLSR